MTVYLQQNGFQCHSRARSTAVFETPDHTDLILYAMKDLAPTHRSPFRNKGFLRISISAYSVHLRRGNATLIRSTEHLDHCYARLRLKSGIGRNSDGVHDLYFRTPCWL